MMTRYGYKPDYMGTLAHRLPEAGRVLFKRRLWSRELLDAYTAGEAERGRSGTRRKTEMTRWQSEP